MPHRIISAARRPLPSGRFSNVMSDLLIGTAGWSYDDWSGIVYPEPAGGEFDKLVYLARMVDTLEVNSTFYRIPSVRTTASWVRRTAGLQDFCFAVKLYRELTHERRTGSVEALVGQFRDSIEPITDSGRLAAVLLQFPWSFKYTQENLEWLETLIRPLEPLPLAVEVRHSSWLNDDYLDYLTSRSVAFCNIDQPQLGRCLPPTDISTADLAYVRLHGRNSAEWFAGDTDVAQRYNYLYSIGELREWAGRIRTLKEKSNRVVVYANNHFCGQAVANALQLKSILLNRRIAVPAQLTYAFPELHEINELKSGGDAEADAEHPCDKSGPPNPDEPLHSQTGWLFDDLK